MSWLILAAISYFLAAVVLVFDKFLLSHKSKDPLVYSFYVSSLSLLVFLLWPFDFSLIPSKTALVAFIAGASFFPAIYFLNKAVKEGEADRAAAISGGVSPVLVLILSFFFLEEKLPESWLWALCLLIFGGIILSLGSVRSLGVKAHKAPPFFSFVSAVFFALTFFSTKYVFLSTSFINGFAWTRIGLIVPVIAILLSGRLRAGIRQNPLSVSKRLFLFFAANKTLSGVAFLLLNYAISLGSVSVINAMQGIQFMFIFFITAAISFFRPGLVGEKPTLGVIIKKISGIVSLTIALVLLFLYS
ncbi:MAG: EamA family transporter [Candidatus Pacebacteria bacterium]|nr:EamA family transporter [Candidatus Paceibacterota bacterium]